MKSSGEHPEMRRTRQPGDIQPDALMGVTLRRGKLRNLPEQCPVLKEAQMVAGSAQQLARSARRLRRSLNLCARCSLAESCGLIGELHWQIQVAVREVAQELGLL